MSGDSCILGDSVRLKITTCSGVLRRFLRRFLEVGFEHLQVVLRGDAFAVAQPHRNDMSGERLREFRLS